MASINIAMHLLVQDVNTRDSEIDHLGNETVVISNDMHHTIPHCRISRAVWLPYGLILEMTGSNCPLATAAIRSVRGS